MLPKDIKIYAIIRQTAKSVRNTEEIYSVMWRGYGNQLKIFGPVQDPQTQE